MAARLIRTVGTGTANTAKTVTSPSEGPLRLLFTTVKYSASPTQAGVTVTLNSGAGAAYDTVLSTGTENAQANVYAPTGEIIISPDDVVDVLAPAGGADITAAIAIYTRPA